MEFKIESKSKNSLKATIVNGTHKSLNLLQSELLTDKGVTFAAYRHEHPLTEDFTFIVKTQTKDAQTSVGSAANSAIKKVTEFKKELLSAIK
ncbi:hypothetical protein COT72_02570 [archaeon CG10_big_fil_rev_8_21_14_0_10_43_11]|nr:MAG: hypothetical protein COT72_02570 [archaeon CG10_big_fil_rev_8_21_14_0_10_43_11]